jgi:hypothetical protein
MQQMVGTRMFLVEAPQNAPVIGYEESFEFVSTGLDH